MDMVTPSINTLLSKVDSRYTLVVLASKRARQIQKARQVMKEHENEEKDLVKAQVKSIKDVTNALAEIAEGKITYSRTKIGMK